jgi:hypothetical protein
MGGFTLLCMLPMAWLRKALEVLVKFGTKITDRVLCRPLVTL